jgi:hypothetical protein
VPKRRAVQLEGHGNNGKAELRDTFLAEKLCLLSMFSISNRGSKESSCAHKGLVSNWPPHTIPKTDLYLLGSVVTTPRICANSEYSDAYTEIVSYGHASNSQNKLAACTTSKC